MAELKLSKKSHLSDKDVYFCCFTHERDKELKVTVSAQRLSEFKKDFKCDDLETICRYAAEYALSSGEALRGEIEITGKIYLGVKKRLKGLR